MWGDVARRPVDGEHLQQAGGARIDGHQHRQPEPFADHDLAPPHRPGEHGKQQAAFDLARDERTRDHRGAQRQHAAEHERDHDQQLRGDELGLTGLRQLGEVELEPAVGHVRLEQVQVVVVVVVGGDVELAEVEPAEVST